MYILMIIIPIYPPLRAMASPARSTPPERIYPFTLEF